MKRATASTTVKKRIDDKRISNDDVAPSHRRRYFWRGIYSICYNCYYHTLLVYIDYTFHFYR